MNWNYVNKSQLNICYKIPQRTFISGKYLVQINNELNYNIHNFCYEKILKVQDYSHNLVASNKANFEEGSNEHHHKPPFQKQENVVSAIATYAIKYLAEKGMKNSMNLQKCELCLQVLWSVQPVLSQDKRREDVQKNKRRISYRNIMSLTMKVKK